MKIKATWGFKGDPSAVGTADGRVLAGTVLTVDDKYAHHLIGANLAKPHGKEDEAAYRARVDHEGIDPAELAAAQAAVSERAGALKDAEKALEDATVALETRKTELDELQAALADRERAVAEREAAADLRYAELEKATAEAAAGSGKGPKETKPAASKESK